MEARFEVKTIRTPFDQVDAILRQEYAQGWRMLSLVQVGKGFSEIAHIVLERPVG